MGVAMNLRSRVLEALGTVYDPELDEPITTLGFVGSCVVTDAGDVSVRLRLPDAAVRAELRVPDGRRRAAPPSGASRACGRVDVVLEDHYTGAEINAAVGRGGAFSDAFPGETRGELDALRALFQRKALVARQGAAAASSRIRRGAPRRAARAGRASAAASCGARWASTRPTTRRRSSPATATPVDATSTRGSGGWRR